VRFSSYVKVGKMKEELLQRDKETSVCVKNKGGKG
jgi:hypothetical protein